MEYFAQDEATGSIPTLTVYETLSTGSPNDMVPAIRNILGGFLFSGDDVYKKAGVLSGGERTRLAVARMLLRPSNTLLLDEPTNHLDLDSKDVLLDALEDYGGTLIFVSPRPLLRREAGDEDHRDRARQRRRLSGDVPSSSGQGARRRTQALRKPQRRPRPKLHEAHREVAPSGGAPTRSTEARSRRRPQVRADTAPRQAASAWTPSARSKQAREAPAASGSRTRRAHRRARNRGQGARGRDGRAGVLRRPRGRETAHRPPPGADVGGRRPDGPVGGPPGTRPTSGDVRIVSPASH